MGPWPSRCIDTLDPGQFGLVPKCPDISAPVPSVWLKAALVPSCLDFYETLFCFAIYFY